MALSGGLHITSANQQQRRPEMMIAVGVDTHKHQHLAVAVDALGQLLAEITITATRCRGCSLLTAPASASAHASITSSRLSTSPHQPHSANGLGQRATARSS